MEGPFPPWASHLKNNIKRFMLPCSPKTTHTSTSPFSLLILSTPNSYASCGRLTPPLQMCARLQVPRWVCMWIWVNLSGNNRNCYWTKLTNEMSIQTQIIIPLFSRLQVDIVGTLHSAFWALGVWAAESKEGSFYICARSALINGMKGKEH